MQAGSAPAALERPLRSGRVPLSRDRRMTGIRQSGGPATPATQIRDLYPRAILVHRQRQLEFERSHRIGVVGRCRFTPLGLREGPHAAHFATGIDYVNARSYRPPCRSRTGRQTVAAHEFAVYRNGVLTALGGRNDWPARSQWRSLLTILVNWTRPGTRRLGESPTCCRARKSCLP
jgi:hypothetical protein